MTRAVRGANSMRVDGMVATMPGTSSSETRGRYHGPN